MTFSKIKYIIKYFDEYGVNDIPILFNRYDVGIKMRSKLLSLFSKRSSKRFLKEIKELNNIR